MTDEWVGGDWPERVAKAPVPDDDEYDDDEYGPPRTHPAWGLV